MKIRSICLAASLAIYTPASANPAERAGVIDRVAQGVVSVRAETPEPRGPAASNNERETFARVFESLGSSRPKHEGGTGFVIDAAGHIVTASFVLDGAQEVFIGLASGEERPATVVAVDEVSMVAVLKADTAGLAPLSFSKTNPKQGEDVYSVAHAFGLPSALATTGMVAGTNVNFPNEGQRFLVLDMRINRGNAGAPVTDSAGRVVGMATAVYGSDGAAGGLGIAVPAADVEEIAGKLIREGRVARSAIGVIAVGAARGGGGALLESIEENSPAARAGLKGGDVIIRADDVDIRDDQALRRYVAARPVGAPIAISYRRKGELLEAVVTTIERR